MFKEAYENDQLISPKICAEFLKWLLCDLSLEFKQSKMPISIYDQWHHQFWLKDASQLHISFLTIAFDEDSLKPYIQYRVNYYENRHYGGKC